MEVIKRSFRKSKVLDCNFARLIIGFGNIIIAVCSSSDIPGYQFNVKCVDFLVDNGKICSFVKRRKKITIFMCLTFVKHFGFIFIPTPLVDRKIQDHEKRTFLFL